ncbi:hypothetical protein C7271_26345, partial [filamentous cyanobacterium CCP5]
ADLSTSHSPISPSPDSLTLIHRDFYPDQILVDHNRLWLVDLDLGCLGDPALDMGNFIAHMIEQSLRLLGDPAAMQAQAVALQRTYGALADADFSGRIEFYTLLSLVRHLHISDRILDRRPHTEAILSLCENWIGHSLGGGIVARSPLEGGL